MIQLKPLLPAHKELTFNWRNDPEIYQWCRQTDLLDWNAHCKWFDNVGSDKTIKMYLVETDMGLPVGVCGITDIDLVNARAEFSLYIGREYQCRGYGKAALRALLDHAFKTYPINQVWGETMDGNPAMDMFLSLGMTMDGTRKDFYFKRGDYLDAHLLSITRGRFYDRISVVRNSIAT